jgi:hypothetical protein
MGFGCLLTGMERSPGLEKERGGLRGPTSLRGEQDGTTDHLSAASLSDAHVQERVESRLPRSRSADDLPDVLTRLGDCDHIVWFHTTVVCRCGALSRAPYLPANGSRPCRSCQGWASPAGGARAEASGRATYLNARRSTPAPFG